MRLNWVSAALGLGDFALTGGGGPMVFLARLFLLTACEGRTACCCGASGSEPDPRSSLCHPRSTRSQVTEFMDFKQGTRECRVCI